MKNFNITAVCVPQKHYMVDISEKLNKITKLVERDEYFTINKSRQYGKTTTLFALSNHLSPKYDVIFISFEGLGDDAFSSGENFATSFINKVAAAMRFTSIPSNLIEKWMNQEDENDVKYTDSFSYLSNKITTLCEKNDKEIVLLIDEVDKSSDNQIFLHFLGMLRNKYLERQMGRDATFKSVILAGVYDVKNLKLKIRDDDEKKYNSPWNIAADFNVDMSFSVLEIKTMLEAYENDNRTGMDINHISEQIYFYSNGYPYLVSWICKWIDENNNRQWNEESIRQAQKELLRSNNTLFDDISKNIENNSNLKSLIKRVIYDGEEIGFNIANPEISLGVMFGLFVEKNNLVAISSIIFETYLFNYFSSEEQIKNDKLATQRNQFIEDGKLDMQRVLLKFQEIMKSEYRNEDAKFIEQQGRLLFLCFIKPIINGAGFYFVEPETRNNTRMDIVIVYGGEEHIIELKIWHGEKYMENGVAQLYDYMDSRNNKKGYLLSFSFNKNKEYSCNITNDENKGEIFEIVV